MKKLRVSYSILNAWDQGNKQQAIDAFLHKPMRPSKAMEMGTKYHQDWSKYVLSQKKLPEEFGGFSLSEPVSEVKIVRELPQAVQLVGIVDLYDKPTIYEFKTGRRSASSYALSKQHMVYHLLLDGEPTKAIYMRYDQYSQQADAAIIHLSTELMEITTEWVLNTSTELREELERQGLWTP